MIFKNNFQVNWINSAMQRETYLNTWDHSLFWLTGLLSLRH